jgi:hypothetical protein
MSISPYFGRPFEGTTSSPARKEISRARPQETKSRGRERHPPGKTRSVDADLYDAMKRAFLKVVPKSSPGITLAGLRKRLLKELPEDLYPKGAKASWWSKTVQLDLEAKRIIERERSKPLRLRVCSPSRRGTGGGA